MKELVTEQLLKKIKNRFVLSIAAAKRARQLKDGAVPLVTRDDDGSPDLIVALNEIMANKIDVTNDDPELLTPEVIIKE